MYSQCPDCQTRFRVTADALRAARGTVRCGRCGSAFDALERLTDSIPSAAHDASSPSLLVATDNGSGMLAGQQSAATVEYHFSAEDLERVFVEASEWHEVDEPPLAEGDATPMEADAAREPVGVDAEAPIVVELGNAGFEDITLEGERISIEALTDSLPVFEPQAADADLDSTDELQILEAVPDSAYPEEVEVPPVDTAAVDLDVGAPEPTTPEIELPPAVEPPPSVAEPLPLSAQRWRRPADAAPSRTRRRLRRAVAQRWRGHSPACCWRSPWSRKSPITSARTSSATRSSARRCARYTSVSASTCCRTGTSRRWSCASGATSPTLRPAAGWWCAPA